MTEPCKHEPWEKDVAVDADGFCPLCQTAEVDRLREENEGLRLVLTNIRPIIETLNWNSEGEYDAHLGEIDGTLKSGHGQP